MALKGRRICLCCFVVWLSLKGSRRKSFEAGAASSAAGMPAEASAEAGGEASAAAGPEDSAAGTYISHVPYRAIPWVIVNYPNKAP